MDAAARSYLDRPFAPPLDVVLDVPVPPSVNRTRKVHWAGHRKYEAWKRNAGFHLLANGQYRASKQIRLHRYELTVILNEAMCRLDPDNTIKAACDFLKGLEVIADDSPQQARKITIEWGDAPDGCRLIVRPVG